MATPAERPGDGSDDLDEQWAELTARIGPLQVPEPAGGPRDYVAPEVDERFTPPEPGPIITGTSRNLLPWLAATGGPLLLLLTLMLWPGAPSAAYLLLTAVSVAGLAVLLWRLPHRRSDDDDGAVV